MVVSHLFFYLFSTTTWVPGVTDALKQTTRLLFTPHGAKNNNNNNNISLHDLLEVGRNVDRPDCPAVAWTLCPNSSCRSFLLAPPDGGGVGGVEKGPLCSLWPDHTTNTQTHKHTNTSQKAQRRRGGRNLINTICV